MNSDGQGWRQSKHVYVGDTRVVTKRNYEGETNPGYEQVSQYWYHGDHLGSAQAVTDCNGVMYERLEYTPYGEVWIEERGNGEEGLPFRFTGKEMDEETGLYYYGARYLDPKMSRWLSADPAMGDYVPGPGMSPDKLSGLGGVYNVINLHTYHYAANNPVKYTDPTGREVEILGTPEYIAEVNRLLEEAELASPDFKSKMKELRDNKEIKVTIRAPETQAEKNGGSSTLYSDVEAFANNRPSGSEIVFDPSKTVYDTNTNFALPPVTGIAHEIGHAYFNMKGGFNGKANVWDMSTNPPTFIYNKDSESNAINFENEVRLALGLPYRSNYGGFPVNIMPESIIRLRMKN
ncbi:RHS repeat-associated core domain-containing protein [Breznakiella homolactica]|uniref:Teneurin-like YD-shell domain-containing protein n=1 Tax=Breznakiella homolactica TaxID=2798577 RepID=A0A7T7XQN2_9SPIR|nr:RHS repeat-associated core domain-containing protein [Breznakiella homolactica]QQO10710.1 hypothetical protein JFL75_07295 [Breznakiella homolactica]